MIIYHYADNGEYFGSSAALLDPLETQHAEAEVYLIPRNATKIEPPDPQSGYARVFSNGEWIHVLDKRGVVYWLSHANQGVITELGQDIPDGASLEPPPVPEPDPLSAASLSKDKLLAQIEALKSRIEAMEESDAP